MAKPDLGHISSNLSFPYCVSRFSLSVNKGKSYNRHLQHEKNQQA
jgi:hypothetical protein